ncbi:GIY-YIG nuclease family protein [Chryseobacterium sp. 5_R23647]|uniref:GIY-YIG nuclease family protein n=1 Tax=Chryseobacterium sp. 5_R23647 TaxID=2258964 RepID=UPI000E25CED8|nr:hypothetical protein [Chryseobacterium sp. 5_R23647]REC40766.1 hypothetical protein DRF69_17355 [Chryseobacterium sp. 5_R23647]
MLDAIIKSIKGTAKDINEHIDYPICPGIYAFMLKENSHLNEFGTPNRVLYVGIAKDSLKKRDLGNHFNNKSTGRSTLRRSLGAILKKEFNLTAFSRNGTNSKKEILNYKFNSEGEKLLTEWMNENLIVGYWKDEQSIAYSKLRDFEEDVIKFLKPTLDLDARTKKYNTLANKLDLLREICREQAIANI